MDVTPAIEVDNGLMGESATATGLLRPRDASAAQALEASRDDFTVYVRPELVAEVAFGDVQESPRYPARLALRLARVEAYRPDKPASGADTGGS